MRIIPQSSTVTVLIGPFLDSVDASPETGLTIANTDILISKGAGATGAKNESSSATHRAQGMYAVTFNATDTGTIGDFDVIVKMSGALLVHNHFRVVPAALVTTLGTAPGANGGLPTVDANNRIAGIQGTVANTLDGLLNSIIEDQPNVTLRAALAYLVAHAVGVSSGMNGTTGTLKSPNGSETRAVATLDGLGNRTAVTLTAPTL